ncbi:hypothetical protein AB7M49_005660 [Bradyrhizobium elkanii]
MKIAGLMLAIAQEAEDRATDRNASDIDQIRRFSDQTSPEEFGADDEAEQGGDDRRTAASSESERPLGMSRLCGEDRPIVSLTPFFGRSGASRAGTLGRSRRHQ